MYRTNSSISSPSSPSKGNILNVNITNKLINGVSKFNVVDNNNLQSHYYIFAGFWNNSDIDPYYLGVNETTIMDRNPYFDHMFLNDFREGMFNIFRGWINDYSGLSPLDQLDAINEDTSSLS